MTMLRIMGCNRLRYARLTTAALTGLAPLLLPGCSTVDVTVRPSDDLQQMVQAAGTGSVFRLTPGVYRMQSIVPKDNQHFIGQDGVVLNGARVLPEWRRDGTYWVADAGQRRLAPHGECEDGQDLCKFREDLFVDGVLYKAVASRDQVGPGKWHHDGDDIILSDDPTGKLVEISTAPWAINGAAKGVIFENLIVEKYASAAQSGAIDGRSGKDWKMIDVVARWNHGVGLYLGHKMQVTGGSFSNNGQLGIGGEGIDVVIDGVEVAANNYAGFSANWEAGGTKFVRSRKLEVRNSCIYDNVGPGLWTDIDNIDVVYANNKVFRNAGDGIKHEISYAATIVENVVAQNGKGHDVWLWGSQILIQNSSNVEVRDNTVEVAAGFGNGISIVSQDRGGGKLGDYKVEKNLVRDNTIIFMGQHGHSGLVADAAIEEFWKTDTNRFDQNTYILAEPRKSLFGINNHFGTWNEAQAQGFEKNGTLMIEKKAPIPLTCDK